MRRLIALLALVIAGACGGESATGPTPQSVSIVGTYTLKFVGGAPLPAVANVGGVSITVTGGSLNMNANGTCAYSIIVVGGTLGAACTYVRQNDTFVLTGNNGSTVSGSFTNGNTINFVDSGFNLTFQR